MQCVCIAGIYMDKPSINFINKNMYMKMRIVFLKVCKMK